MTLTPVSGERCCLAQIRGLQLAGIWSSGATALCGPCGLTRISWKSAAPPVVVVHAVGADRMGDAWFSVSGEGTLAYIVAGEDIAATDTVPEAILVKNWFEELKRLVPTD